MICPKDYKPCIDDLCHAGDCIRFPGLSPLRHCPGGCGSLVSDDDKGDCSCEPDYDDPDEHDAIWGRGNSGQSSED